MSGFNFGTPNTGQPAVPSFGTQASATATGFSFGLGAQAPAATPAPTNVTFGVSKATGFSFGAPASTASAIVTPQPQSTFTFPNPTATVAPQQQFGLSPATPAAVNPAQPSSLGFSTPAQQTGFSFGQQQQQTAQPTAAPAATPSLSFGMPSAAQKPATGLTSSQPATGFGFGQTSCLAPTSAAPAPLSFGLPATTTTAAAPLALNPLTTATPSTGLSFGQTATQAPPLFGASQQSSLIGSLAPTAAPITAISSAPQVVGLGGIDMNTAQPKATEGKSESTKVKEAQVPKEILQTVEDFKTYVKQQKTLSSDIIRTTDRKLKTVSEEIKRLNSNVQEVANNVDNNKLAIKLLRSDTSKIIQHADMAQRTHETPSGLQFENVMPQIYFNELIQKYENDLLTLKHQVELTEKHLQTLSNPQNFTAQDLKRGLQQLHESFIALAGRVQEAHTKVESQKDQYLNLRKFILRDSTNVFEEQEANVNNSPSVTKVQYGPNPFTSSMLGSGLNQSAARTSPLNPSSSWLFGNSSFKRM